MRCSLENCNSGKQNINSNARVKIDYMVRLRRKLQYQHNVKQNSWVKKGNHYHENIDVPENSRKKTFEPT